MTEPQFHDPDLTRFYDPDNPWDTDKDYCLALASGASSVLDLGCGTGELATVLARSRRVAGVEPAAAMLAHARRRQGADKVHWVEADACTVRLGETFDLVVMTGHAFQCLLTEADQWALCATIAAHLAPGGTFIFDSRNPLVEEWRNWTPDKARWTLSVPDLGEFEAWNDVRFDPATQIAAYDTVYRDRKLGQSWQATSRILFSQQAQIAAAIASAGLQVHRWMGDWTGGSMTAISPEIIPVGGLAD
ncbi:class I SAM-dependent methyltransferase [Hoeflea alexandrii]|uniref:class I SAM-dependent methyltransferase n=1 Tax=Hoeflea alexandrii TaxID=288436 RepID=UPI0035CF144D